MRIWNTVWDVLEVAATRALLLEEQRKKRTQAHYTHTHTLGDEDVRAGFAREIARRQRVVVVLVGGGHGGGRRVVLRRGAGDRARELPHGTGERAAVPAGAFWWWWLSYGLMMDMDYMSVKLRYAIALAKSKKRDDKYRGIGLLEDLLEQEHDQKECLYWIALTYYGLGEYRASRSHCERLIRMDPNHTKALALHDCIKEVVASGASSMHASPRYGILGVGLVGAVVVAGIALRLLLKR
ncbi:Membrane protein involved in organellar division, partial [Globisporangium splendens]